MSELSKRDRLEATIQGLQTDRPPVALWRHFPVDDQNPDALAASTLAFQRQYDFDFVKVTPASSYCVRDWGASDEWVGNAEGTREYTQPAVSSPKHWLSLRELQPGEGALGAQLQCLEQIRNAVGDQVPFIQTIFNPLSQAKNLTGKTALTAHARQHPDAVRRGLEVITRTTVSFVESARRLGIAGVFLAVQHASYSVLSEDEYREWGMPHDLRILEAADGLWLNVLHLHGERVMFDLLAGYPVQVVNWHDRETPPSLAEGKALTKCAVLGGLRQWETMMRGTPDDVVREARDAMAQTGCQRFILGTGCVTPITAPWANLRAARQVVVDWARAAAPAGVMLHTL